MMGTVGSGLAGTGRARGDAQWAAAVLLVLGLVVTGFGAASLAHVPWRQASLHLAARDWPATQATVLDLALREEPGSARTGGEWRLVLSARYAYEVEGARYESGRISLAEAIESDDRRVQALYSRLHFARVTGRSVTVQYDPADPASARLDGGFAWRRAAVDGGVGLLLLLAGAALLRGAARSRHGGR